MDEDTVVMWTVKCVESIKDQIDHDLLIPVMDKIIWAILQAYQAGLVDGEDGRMAG